MTEWPRDPSMPTGIRDLVSLIVPFGDAPGGTVTDAEGRTLAADGSGDLPGQTLPMLSGPDDQQVAFIVEGTGPLTYSVPNTDGRTYGQGLVGPGLAARVEGIEATAGQTDQIGSDAGGGTVWLDPAGPAGALEVEVARDEKGKGSGQRLVDLDLGGVDDDRVTVTVPDGSGAAGGQQRRGPRDGHRDRRPHRQRRPARPGPVARDRAGGRSADAGQAAQLERARDEADRSSRSGTPAGTWSRAPPSGRSPPTCCAGPA